MRNTGVRKGAESFNSMARGGKQHRHGGMGVQLRRRSVHAVLIFGGRNTLGRGKKGKGSEVQALLVCSRNWTKTQNLYVAIHKWPTELLQRKYLLPMSFQTPSPQIFQEKG